MLAAPIRLAITPQDRDLQPALVDVVTHIARYAYGFADAPILHTPLPSRLHRFRLALRFASVPRFSLRFRGTHSSSISTKAICC